MSKKILLSIARLAMTTAPIVSLGNCGFKSQPAPTLDSIELSGEYKTNYYVGENLDLTGLVVTGNFNNGSSRILSNEEYTTDPKEGTALTVNDTSVTVTATVDGVKKTNTFSITVTKATLQSIDITSPAKTSYFAGQELDLTGLVVTGNFEGGTNSLLIRTNRLLTTSEYTTSPAAGTALTVNDTSVTVTATVDGVKKTNTFSITVTKATLQSIDITSPAKTSYFAGQELDLTGLVVTGNFEDGTNRLLTTSEYTTSPAAGTALTVNDTSVTVTATVDGVKKTNTFSITVSPVVLESITLNTDSTKTNYYVGESLDLTGLVVTGHLYNGSNRQLNLEEYTSTPTEETVLDSEGSQQITIAAKQDTTKTATFNVTVQKTDFEFTLDASGKSYTLTKCKNVYIEQPVIPATFNGKPVAGIGENAFKYCADLVSVTFPNSVTSIGANAFIYCCGGPVSVTIPNSVTTIGDGAFSGCIKLSSIDVSQFTATKPAEGWSQLRTFENVHGPGIILINNPSQKSYWESYFKIASDQTMAFDSWHWWHWVVKVK